MNLKDKNLSKVRLVSKNKIVDELNKGEVSILMLTHVDYRTGELYDIKKISKIARKMGIKAVPMFIVANQYAVSGAQGTEFWKDVVKDIKKSIS